MVKRFIYKRKNDKISSRKNVIFASRVEKKEENVQPIIDEVIKEDVIENKEEIKEEVMETKEKIQMAAAILNAEQPKVKKVKKDKGLIERTESSITILTEDNRELLKD